MTRDEMRKHFLLNGSTSVWALIDALWPGFANELRRVAKWRKGQLFSLRRFSMTTNDEEGPRMQTASPSMLRDIGLFGSKLLLIYLLVILVFPPLVPTARIASVDWAISSLENRGAVYAFLRAQSDPKMAVATAEYLERRGNINAAIVAWEAASEILQERTMPPTQREIRKNIQRLQVRQKQTP